MSSEDRVRRLTLNQVRKPLDLDLNALPLEAIMTRSRSMESQEAIVTFNAPIDVEAYDDDVIISSPRSFAEARNNARRCHGHFEVVDVETAAELRPSRNIRRRLNENGTTIAYNPWIILDNPNINMQNQEEPRWLPLPLLPPTSPKELFFNCPVCMSQLVEETSTKCGHIFCRGCIKTAIAVQNKCPTCRKKVTSRDIFRIYLPTTSFT